MASINAEIDKENVSSEEIDCFTVKKLQEYLREHGQPVGGNSAVLKERAKGVLDLNLPTVISVQQQDFLTAQIRNSERFYTKHQEVLPHPTELKGGWTDDLALIPLFHHKELYEYLVSNNDRTFDNAPMGAHKQVKAKVMFVDSHVHDVKYHPISDTCTHCYVKCRHIPSLPSADGKYNPDHYVWVSLSKVDSQIHSADCSCTAGCGYSSFAQLGTYLQFISRNGESCNHVAALLWTMTKITDKNIDGTLASTSHENKWLKPRKRKGSPKKAEDIVFKKVMTCEEKKPSHFRSFNPAGPPSQNEIDADKFRAQMQECLPNAGYHKLFEQPPISEESKLKCCIPEPPFQYFSTTDLKSEKCQEEFKAYELGLTFDPSEIENLTRGQSSNKLWVSARKGRITASNFGTVMKNQGLKTKSVVKTVMGYYASPVSDALDWGRKHEKTALCEYKKSMKSKGSKVSVEQCGLVIDKKYVFLGASPDGVVSCNGEIGLLEVKCPFSYRCSTPEEAAENKEFCCELVKDGLRLKEKHSYFYQVQGQMALTGHEWCDFVVWTLRGISVQRIHFDKCLWNTMCTKLTSFYRNYIIPEIYTSKVRRDIE